MGRSEFEFIASIQQRAVIRPPVVVGIGDDAAVLDPSRHPQVVTTDMLMEGVDFLWPQASAEQIGRKALGVNLSDIAAMGCVPTAAFVSLALPRARGREFADQLYQGLFALAEEFGVTIAGGDTNTWDGPLVINVTVLGTPIFEQPVLRSGARPGDRILVTGALGGSLLGRHLAVRPRLAEIRAIRDRVEVHSLIDVSDGFAADLHHVLAASGCGAEIDAARLPIHPDAKRMADGRSPLEHALGDGEDFELILTTDRGSAELLLSTWTHPTPLTDVGCCTEQPGCRLRHPDGSLTELPPLGWTHAVETP